MGGNHSSVVLSVVISGGGWRSFYGMLLYGGGNHLWNQPKRDRNRYRSRYGKRCKERNYIKRGLHQAYN